MPACRRRAQARVSRQRQRHLGAGQFRLSSTLAATSNGANGLREGARLGQLPRRLLRGQRGRHRSRATCMSVTDALNTRFDIYDSNRRQLTCPATEHVRRRSTAARTWCGNGGNCQLRQHGARSANSISSGESDHAAVYPANPTIHGICRCGQIPHAMGHPRDMCHAVSIDGICSGGTDRQRRLGPRRLFPRQLWLDDRASGSATPLMRMANRWLPRHDAPRRYQVYKWEIANPSTDDRWRRSSGRIGWAASVTPSSLGQPVQLRPERGMMPGGTTRRPAPDFGVR